MSTASVSSRSSKLRVLLGVAALLAAAPKAQTWAAHARSDAQDVARSLAEGVAAQVGSTDDGGTRVKVSGFLPASLEELRNVLVDLESFPRWFPTIREWRVLARDEHGSIVHGSQDLPWPLGNRDYVVHYTSKEPNAGRFTLEARSAEEPSRPPTPGAIRLTNLKSTWTLTAAENQSPRTHVSYEYEGSIGGRIPGWAYRLGWRLRAADVLHGLMAEVLERRSSR